MVFKEVFTRLAERQGCNVFPCTPANVMKVMWGHACPRCLRAAAAWAGLEVRYCYTILALLAHSCVSLDPIIGLGSDLSHRVAAASVAVPLVIQVAQPCWDLQDQSSSLGSTLLLTGNLYDSFSWTILNLACICLSHVSLLHSTQELLLFRARDPRFYFLWQQAGLEGGKGAVWHAPERRKVAD